MGSAATVQAVVQTQSVVKTCVYLCTPPFEPRNNVSHVVGSASSSASMGKPKNFWSSCHSDLLYVCKNTVMQACVYGANTSNKNSASVL